LSKEIARSINKKGVVTDDIILEIVTKRLRERDCWSIGWILDGFPRSIEQLNEMESRGLAPDKIIFLEWESELETAESRSHPGTFIGEYWIYA